jgi:membrane protease YdiL (CAAX protease family)
VPVVLAAIVVRAVTRQPNEDWIRWGGTVGNYPPAVFWAWQLAYPLHCSLQELMGRGIIQGALQRFMTSGHPLTPIVMTSALFGVYHLYVSMAFAAITFAVSMALGLLYRRHTTLLGVCVLHYVLGLASVAIGLN